MGRRRRPMQLAGARTPRPAEVGARWWRAVTARTAGSVAGA